MRDTYGNRGSRRGPIVMVVVALVTLVVVTVGTLWVSGRFATQRPAPHPAGPPEGTIAVPITSQVIPAYTRLTRDHFWNKKTGTFAIVYLYPREITRGMLTSWDDIRGRVLAVDKAPGYAINENDLLPKGTRPGLAGGTPHGKVAMVLEASRIHGIHGLLLGDHFDLLASVSLETKPASGRDVHAMLQALQPTDPLNKGKKKTQMVVLAEDAVLVVPVSVRYLPSQNAAKGKGAEPKGKPVEEVVIAVDPSEVMAITEGLAIDAGITAIARSGRPDSPRSSIKSTALSTPEGPKAIEVIHGNTRATVIFAPDGTRVVQTPGSPDILLDPTPSKQ
jgi:hypothetical protein